MVLSIQFKTLNKFNTSIRYFGNKSRYESITDLVFINDNLLVCADRSDKILHLVTFDYNLGTSKIIHSIDLPHHPDLIERKGNIIYIVNLNDCLTVCEVVHNNTKLILHSNNPINFGYQYHGLCINNKELFLASTHKYKLMTVYNIDSGLTNNLVIPRLENCFLKDIIFVSDNMAIIIACDSGPSKDKILYKSHLNLYKYEGQKFTFLDGMTYNDCHMDSVVFAKGHYFVTGQMNDVGILLTGYIEAQFIIPMNHISVGVDDFPHGLAISKSQKYIGHTSYSAGTVVIDLLEHVI